MKVLQLIAASEYMELLLSDGRAVRIPGKLVEKHFVGKLNANWLYVYEMFRCDRPLGIEDVAGRASEQEKAEIVGAVSEHLAECGCGAAVTFE